MSDNDKLNVFIVDRKTVVIGESYKFTKKTVGLNDDKSELLFHFIQQYFIHYA